MNTAARLIRIEFDALPERLQLLRCVLREVTEQAGFTPAQRDAVVLAVNEACANVIQHAYAGREPGPVVLEVQALDGGLAFELSDWGRSAAIEQLQPRPLEQLRPGGLGMHFMQCILDGMEYHPSAQGNRMRMRVYRECGQGT